MFETGTSVNWIEHAVEVAVAEPTVAVAVPDTLVLVDVDVVVAVGGCAVGVGVVQPNGVYSTSVPAGGAEPQVEAVKRVPFNCMPVAGLPTVAFVAP